MIIISTDARNNFHCCFFFNDTATTEIYTLSLHDALPAALSGRARQLRADAQPAAQRPHVGPGRGRRDRGGARRDADVPAMKLGWDGFYMEGIPALEGAPAARGPDVAGLNPKAAAAGP